MAQVIRDHARLRGEDVIGSFTLTGAFRLLSDAQIVELAKRIEAAPPIE